MPLYLTNIASMSAMRTLNNVTSGLNTVFQRLSSGKRINSAKDDPAGLMIADRLTAQINGYKQGSRNLNDGISVAQTMEHALDESKDMLQRIRTLAVQAATGTYSDADRKAMDTEAQELCYEITRISNSTTFGGAQILAGNKGGLFSSNGSIDIQCSGTVGDKISIQGFADGFSISGIASYLNIPEGESCFKPDGDSLAFSLTSAANAESVLGCIDKYINTVSTYQARLGAVQNPLGSVLGEDSLGLDALCVSTCAGLGQAECAELLALSERDQVFLLLLFRSVGQDRIAAQGSVRADDNGGRSAYFCQLFDTHHVGQRIAALAAVFLRDRDAHEAVLLHLGNGLSGKHLCLIHIDGIRFYFLLGEVSEEGSRHLMCFV